MRWCPARRRTFEETALQFRCGRGATEDQARALPRICKDQNLPSEQAVLARRGIIGTLKPAQPDFVPDGQYHHTVSKYLSDGAAAGYLAELRAAVTECGGYTSGNFTWEYALAGGGTVGDESLALTATYRRAEPQEGSPREATFRISVVRVGAYVSVVFDSGWEGSPSPDAALDQLFGKAVTRLSAL